MNTHDPDSRFDDRLRHTWQQAARQLPGPLQLKLSPALAMQRHAAATPARRWLPAAAACASLALAIGLWWSPGPQPASGSHAAPAIAQQRADEDVDAGELLARNPDFYAWLGSDDARTLAME